MAAHFLNRGATGQFFILNNRKQHRRSPPLFPVNVTALLRSARRKGEIFVALNVFSKKTEVRFSEVRQIYEEEFNDGPV